MSIIDKKNLVIAGQRIYLRPLNIEDASEKYCQWLNDEEINKYLETREATIESLQKYIMEKNPLDDCLFLGIFWKENNFHIGNIKLEPINFQHKTAVISIMIGDKNFWGRGIAVEAINCLTGFAKNLDLEKISLGVISENKAAIRVYEKCGFKTVDLISKVIDHDDILYDKVIMELNLN